MEQFTHAADIGRRIIELTRTLGREMDQQESEDAIHLNFLPSDFDRNKLVSASKAFEMGFGRASYLGLMGKIEDPALLWLILLAKGVPGNISLMCTVVAAAAQDKHAPKPITLDYLMSEVFPFRIPSAQVFSQVWGEQKLNCQNLVDSLPYL